jgi:hypothetical protein
MVRSIQDICNFSLQDLKGKFGGVCVKKVRRLLELALNGTAHF